MADGDENDDDDDDLEDEVIRGLESETWRYFFTSSNLIVIALRNYVL